MQAHIRLAPVFASHQRRAATDDQALSLRKNAGLLVCLAGPGCGRLAASPYSNLENRLPRGWDARLGGLATHDIALEIAKRGHLISHRIDPAVDAERDFVGVALSSTSSVSRQEYLHWPEPVFQALTTSGETYHSDGRILLLDLQTVNPDKINVAGQPSAVVGATLPVANTAESFQSKLTSPF